MLAKFIATKAAKLNTVPLSLAYKSQYFYHFPQPGFGHITQNVKRYKNS